MHRWRQHDIAAFAAHIETLAGHALAVGEIASAAIAHAGDVAKDEMAALACALLQRLGQRAVNPLQRGKRGLCLRAIEIEHEYARLLAATQADVRVGPAHPP